jgi:uncharacterized protein YeaO (DUF488 family)
MTIKIKRVYEPKEKSDGFRILVDRLWPRGIKKENLYADVWLKEIAPSPALRKWFNHDAEKWKEFKTKYTAEIKKSETLKELSAIIKNQKIITLLYSAKDELHNQAVVLKEYLDKNFKTE